MRRLSVSLLDIMVEYTKNFLLFSHFFDSNIGRNFAKYRVQISPKYMTKQEVKSTLKEIFMPVDFGLQG